MIRYQSLSMPVMVLSETNVNEKDDVINVECDNEDKTNPISDNKNSDNSQKEGRYVVFFFFST